MRQSRLLPALGVLALLLSLVAQLPARVAQSALGFPPGAIRGVEGTVWRGSAQQVAVGGLTVGPIRWTVRPSRLLAGRLAADVEATVPDGFANARVAVTPGGRLILSQLSGAAPLAWLAPAAGAAGGQLTARFEQLTITAGRVDTAIGNVVLGGVVLPIASGRAPLAPGTYAVAFAAEDLPPSEPLTGTLKDEGGPLEIAGTVRITPPRAYEFSGTAKPRPARHATTS